MTRAPLFAFAAIAWVAAADARPPRLPKSDTAPAPILRAVLDCRTTVEAQARLACYDAAVQAFASAETNGDVVVADRAQIRETKRSLFGLTLTPLAIFGGHDDDDGPSEITAKIASVRSLGYGRWELTLDNGMRWQQSDTTDVSPRAGLAVTIKRAALGSYFLKIDHQRAIRAARVG